MYDILTGVMIGAGTGFFVGVVLMIWVMMREED